MTRDHALTKLRAHAADLRRMGASELYLFGSTARDEARPASDVDLFLDYDDPVFSLVELIAIRDRISELMSVQADLTTRGGIHPSLRAEIETTATRVF